MYSKRRDKFLLPALAGATYESFQSRETVSIEEGFRQAGIEVTSGNYPGGGRGVLWRDMQRIRWKFSGRSHEDVLRTTGTQRAAHHHEREYQKCPHGYGSLCNQNLI